MVVRILRVLLLAVLAVLAIATGAVAFAVLAAGALVYLLVRWMRVKLGARAAPAVAPGPAPAASQDVIDVAATEVRTPVEQQTEGRALMAEGQRGSSRPQDGTQGELPGGGPGPKP